MCSADVTIVCGCLMVETVYLGRPQMKAVVPDSTPRLERKSLNAQAVCQCGPVM